MAEVFKWTDEVFAEMKQEYLSRMEELGADAPKHSSEVVAEIAQAYGTSSNGFRMKLSKDGCYVKKEQTASTSKAKSGESKGGSRTSKATAHAELKAALTDGGVTDEDIDAEIIEKLTGKAALHLAELIRKVTK
ncbi:hypothetical protein U7154_000125 [Kononvirus KKP3711]|uniref:D3 protein n=1 Tax=Enterobacter phage KKP_3711 TaxID=3109398 RepID=A0AAX4Q4I4_9CAUD